jgi:hypothetical protein
MRWVDHISPGVQDQPEKHSCGEGTEGGNGKNPHGLDEELKPNKVLSDSITGSGELMLYVRKTRGETREVRKGRSPWAEAL